MTERTQVHGARTGAANVDRRSHLRLRLARVERAALGRPLLPLLQLRLHRTRGEHTVAERAARPSTRQVRICTLRMQALAALLCSAAAGPTAIRQTHTGVIPAIAQAAGTPVKSCRSPAGLCLVPPADAPGRLRGRLACGCWGAGEMRGPAGLGLGLQRCSRCAGATFVAWWSGGVWRRGATRLMSPSM